MPIYFEDTPEGATRVDKEGQDLLLGILYEYGSLVAALEAIEAYIRPAVVPARGQYEVLLRERGRFISDPLRDYQRGRRRVSREELLSLQDTP